MRPVGWLENATPPPISFPPRIISKFLIRANQGKTKTMPDPLTPMERTLIAAVQQQQEQLMTQMAEMTALHIEQKEMLANLARGAATTEMSISDLVKELRSVLGPNGFMADLVLRQEQMTQALKDQALRLDQLSQSILSLKIFMGQPQ